MVLRIIDGAADLVAATSLRQQAMAMRPGVRGDADMHKYRVSPSTAGEQALTTFGAGPCTIIVIRDAAGGGALGHYGGDYRPAAVLSGLAGMAARLGAPQITDVLFAAGMIDDEDQAAFDQGIVDGARVMFAAANVQRITCLSNGEVAGAAIYFPREGVVALYGDDAVGFLGTGGDDGMENDWFPAFG